MPDHFEYLEKPGVQPEFASVPIQLMMIKTKIDNVQSKTILKPLKETGLTGINGGFFEADEGYNEPPTRGASIIYERSDVGDEVTNEGRTLPKNYDYNGSPSNPKSRKTMVIYKDDVGEYGIAYMYARTVDDVLDRYETNGAKVYTVVGGTSFNESDWSSTAYNLPTPRTCVAWKGNYVYLIIARHAITIPQLRESLEMNNLSATNAIVLDGSGSTAMQTIINGSRSKSFYGQNRYLYNAVCLRRNG